MSRALRSAGFVRRAAALTVDLILVSLVIFFFFIFDVFDVQTFRPPPGWFASEWLLKQWLDAPLRLSAPLLTFVGLSIAWNVGWEAAADRTPGARLLRIRTVDRNGLRPGAIQRGLRLLGILLNLASLGLGYGWILISATRRGWHDYLSGTVVVND